MKIPIYQVDAFTSAVFGGNPAAICPLQEWLPDDMLQAIAAENNLSETAFFVPNGDAYELRWFTPETEVDLCGHATLATAHVIYSCLGYPGESIAFRTRSGPLSVAQTEGGLSMDFPARPPVPVPPDAMLNEALGATPREVRAARDVVAVFESEEAVRSLTPNMEALRNVDAFAVCVTAPGDDCDFVCRFFAPKQGIPEDPVTGSAYCSLTPYWAGRLGKTKLRARQVSKRGGEIACEDRGERVRIAGRAVLYLTGEIHV